MSLLSSIAQDLLKDVEKELKASATGEYLAARKVIADKLRQVPALFVAGSVRDKVQEYVDLITKHLDPTPTPATTPPAQ